MICASRNFSVRVNIIKMTINVLQVSWIYPTENKTDCLHGVMVKPLDCGIVVSEFENKRRKTHFFSVISHAVAYQTRFILFLMQMCQE